MCNATTCDCCLQVIYHGDDVHYDNGAIYCTDCLDDE